MQNRNMMMYIKKVKYLLICLMLVMTAVDVNAQQEDSDIKFDDVKVIKEFNADLRDFNKINIDPVLPVFDLASRKFKYQVRAIPARLEYEKPSIRPLALKPEVREAPNKYYLKLGYGMPKFLRTGFALSYKKHNTDAGFSAHYLSADDSENVKDKRNASAGLAFTFFSRDNGKELQYGANAWLDADYLYLYAVEANKDSAYTSSQNKRRLLRGDIKMTVKKDELLESLSNELELRYSFLQLNTNESMENNIFIKNTLSYTVSDNVYWDLPFYLDYLVSNGQYAGGIKPAFIFKSRLVNMRLGAELGKTSEDGYLKPYGELSANLFHNFLEIFTCVDNRIFNNSEFVMTAVNPFLDFDNDSTKTSLITSYAAGVRSSLEGIRLEAKAVYQRFDNKLLFDISPGDPRTFVPLYDDGHNIMFVFNGSYDLLPEVKVGATVTKNFYKMDNEEKAWYTPDFTANFTTSVSMLNDRMHFKGELYFASQSWYRKLDGKKYKLDPVFDISGELRYRLFKHSYLFGEVNNIFAQKYQRWYQYPVYGLNILGGIEIGF